MLNISTTTYYSFKLLGARYAFIIVTAILSTIALMVFVYAFLKGYEKSLLIKIIGSAPHMAVLYPKLVKAEDVATLQSVVKKMGNITLSVKGLAYVGTVDIFSDIVYIEDNQGGGTWQSLKSQSPEIVFKGMELSDSYSKHLQHVLISFSGGEPSLEKQLQAVREIYTEGANREAWDGRLKHRKPIVFPPSLYRELLDPYLFYATYPYIRFPEVVRHIGSRCSLSPERKVEFVVVAGLDSPLSDNTIPMITAYETAKNVFFGSAQGEDIYNYVEFYLDDPMQAKTIAQAIEMNFGKDISVSVWSDKFIVELGIITAFGILLYSIMAGIGLAIGLLISSLLSISVRRKRRQIAVFLALGAKKQFVANLFLSYSIVLAVLGFVGGTLIGQISAYYIWTLGQTDLDTVSNIVMRLIYAELHSIPKPEIIGVVPILGIFFVTIFIAFVSAYGPSITAAKLDPIEGLRES